MAVTDKDLRENTTANNGTNPEAVKEAEAAAKAQAEAAAKNTYVQITSKTLIEQSQSRQITLKIDLPIVTTADQPPVVAPAGTELSLMLRNGDASAYKCLVWAKGFSRTTQYIIPSSAIDFPTGNASGVGRTRAKDINDDLANECKRLVALIGKLPTLKDADGKTISNKSKGHEYWRAQFPGCTLANIRLAFAAIQAFRVDRAKRMAEATTDAEFIAACDEYARAKSWEQDVISTAGDGGCGIM